MFLASFRLLTAAPVTIRQVLPGAVLATAFWLLLQALGGVYVTQVLKGSSQTYGGFAAVVGMLAWLLIAAEITLMAAEVNVVLARKLWPRSLTGDLLPADERTMRDSGEAAQRDRREHIRVTFDPAHAPSDDEPSTSAPPKNLAPRRARSRLPRTLRWLDQARPTSCFITRQSEARSHSDLGPPQRAELENGLLQPGSDAVTPEASGRG